MATVYKRLINKFDLPEGFIIAKKYKVIEKLGSGWEGEVYRVKEKSIGIERAAKLFFPLVRDQNRTPRFYARKLHKLRHCEMLIQYHTQERILYKDVPITVLVSEFVEGELLRNFVRRQPGKKLTPFEALHLLYELASGLEVIHNLKEYHGDLHDANILVRRQGLAYNVKIVDMYNWGVQSAENIRDDVIDLIRLFYDALGGARVYSKLPPEIKSICCGLKRSLISRKFRTAGQLRRYIEKIKWDE